MASLQNVRRRIRSVKNIQQITKAMDMVATSRMRHAKEATIANHPFAAKSQEVFDRIAVQAEELGHPLFDYRENEDGKTLLIVIAADKGLAGAYSSNVFKTAHAEIDSGGDDDDEIIKIAEKENIDVTKKYKDLRRRPRHQGLTKMSRVVKAVARSSYGSRTSSGSHRTTIAKTERSTEEFANLADKGNYDILTVGRKATDHFRHRNFNVVRYYNGISERPKYQHAQDIARFAIDRFLEGEVNEVTLIYTRFISAINCEPRVVDLLPFFAYDRGTNDAMKGEYIYEPDPMAVLDSFLPKYLETLIYEALLQSAASELSSRMNAMSNATDNAQELISKLNLHYNKVRQAGITNEINEIVGGANALN